MIASATALLFVAAICGIAELQERFVEGSRMCYSCTNMDAVTLRDYGAFSGILGLPQYDAHTCENPSANTNQVNCSSGCIEVFFGIHASDPYHKFIRDCQETLLGIAPEDDYCEWGSAGPEWSGMNVEQRVCHEDRCNSNAPLPSGSVTYSNFSYYTFPVNFQHQDYCATFCDFEFIYLISTACFSATEPRVFVPSDLPCGEVRRYGGMYH